MSSNTTTTEATTTQVTSEERKVSCKYCKKDLSHIYGQAKNIERHENKCEKQNSGKSAGKRSNKKRDGDGCQPISKFFYQPAKKVSRQDEAPTVDFSPGPDALPGSETIADSVNVLQDAFHDSDAPPDFEAIADSVDVLSGAFHDSDALPDPNALPHDFQSEVPLPLSKDTTSVPDSPSIDDIFPSTVSVSVQEDASFCSGFKPQLIGSVYDCFPFHLLGNSDVIFSNDSFHAKTCQSNNFFLLEKGSTCNSCCEAIAGDPRWVKLVADANDPERYLSTAKDENMSLHQLKQRLNNQRTRLNNMKLKSLNLTRTLDRVNKSLELHQRFVSIIKENNIPKLHELVKVASNRNRGIEYVIRRMVDAIGGTYNARSSEDDVDLAFLILQYGGPGLLDIVHRALKFPSTSTAYRLLQKSKEMIQSSVNTNIHQFVHNIHPGMQ